MNRIHTDQQILSKAEVLTPFPGSYPEDKVFITVEFLDLGAPVKYKVEYEKGKVHHVDGWIPREIQQL